jgi:hypothetical protein
MQPTDVQVQRTLAALAVESAVTAHRPSPGISRDTLAVMMRELPAGLLEGLDGVPALRADRLDAVRDRLEHGAAPSSDELANRIVGRLVCDRLR